ncbi:MAG: phosphoglycerate kinase [Candidatus Aenigmarchaeota archaeon]|nr:phosphoglycerate kinase [Candidatus Aenigmarchaeota archaeon]
MKYNVRTFEDADFSGKVVYDRVDLNISKSDDVYDDTKIKVIVDDCKRILEDGGKLVLVSHIGRDPNDSLRFLVKDLSRYLERDVKFVNDCIGPKVHRTVKEMKPGDVVLLENVRMYPEEKSNNELFSNALIENMDFGVFDAFPVSHRKHASVVGVMKRKPFYAGPRFLYEMEQLEKFREKREDTVCVLGGIKKEKLLAIEMFLQNGYKVIPGGMPLNVIYKTLGKDVGDSLIGEGEEYINEVKKIITDKNLIIPDRVRIAKKDDFTDTKMIDIDEGVPSGYQIIGFELPEIAHEYLGSANRIMIAGPTDIYEKGFYDSMKEIASYLESTESVIMGANTIEAYKKFNLKNPVLITGGGAGLYFLKNGTNPALGSLEDNMKKFKNK